jgi:DNA polymerase-3 subunit gamma/tau
VSYFALYRKYRPSSFDDLVGQSEISSIIKNEILSNKISHAYLFSGPRGTGKTSTAKIIAKMINCENISSDGVPCGKCIPCLNFYNNSDIVEIDAASNNGVDEIRELRDKFGSYLW